jgi:opacity protein-like surface antigen
MKTMLRSIAMLAVLVSLPVAASAQMGALSPMRLVTFGVGGGLSVPVSDAGDVFKNGFNVQGFARLNLPKLPVMPRFDLSFSQFDLDDAQVGVPGTWQILAGLANVQIGILPFGPVRPYVVAGLGGYNLKTETEGATPTSESSFRFGVNGGAGIAIQLGVINGYVEGRLDNVFTEEGMIDTDQIQVIPVTFGLSF